ncbi:MAG: hypothetical protein ACPHV3_08855 [Vibrio sp.]
MKSQLSIAQDAIELVQPAIEKLFGRTNRATVHIVVMDPSVKPWEQAFEESILLEHSFGDKANWQIPFDELARKKAQQAWRHQTPNLTQQSLHPSSLRDGDLLFYGSFVYGDIVVACSGVEQWYDMLISSWVALAIEQLTMHEYQTIKSNTPTQTTR